MLLGGVMYTEGREDQEMEYVKLKAQIEEIDAQIQKITQKTQPEKIVMEAWHMEDENSSSLTLQKV